MAGDSFTGFGEDLNSCLHNLGDGIVGIVQDAKNAFQEFNKELYNNWQSDNAPDFNPLLNQFAGVINFLNLTKNAIIASAVEGASVLAEDQHEQFVCDVQDKAPVVDILPLKVLGDGAKMTKQAIRVARDEFLRKINLTIAKLGDLIKSIKIPLYDEGGRLVSAFMELLNNAVTTMSDVLENFVTSLNTALVERIDDVTAHENAAAAIMEQ